MAPMSRGQGRLAPMAIKRKIENRILEPGNRHRWESFSQRIAGLKIDPVRRARQSNLLPEKDSSHFKTALEEWKDLNMTANFTEFWQEVQPLCQSLPQILHYREQIADLLLKYLNKGVALSLEPLLSLTTHFAHDMGSKFEPFFERTVAAVCGIATAHQDIDVVEWSFNCLAWLFKYLSRLLVPDLRPLYDLMSPLLGKTPQKFYVTRFAAEAMSYLVRKAGAAYSKDRQPLLSLIDHAFSDAQSMAASKNSSQFNEGLAILFTESVKGVNHGVTSSGPVILQGLIAKLINTSTHHDLVSVDILKVVESTIINVMHHSDADGFEPILSAVLQATRLPTTHCNSSTLEIVAKLLFIIAATRNGERIVSWQPLLERSVECIQIVEKGTFKVDSSAIPAILTALAVILVSVQPNTLNQVQESISCVAAGELWQRHFLPFCILVSNLDSLTFQTVLLPLLQRFIVFQWKEQETEFCLLLSHLSFFPDFLTMKTALPMEWQLHVLSQIRRIRELTHGNNQKLDDQMLSNGYQYLDLTKKDVFASDIKGQIVSEATSIALNSFLNAEHLENETLAMFGFGKAFEIATKFGDLKEYAEDAWENIGKLPLYVYRSTLFLQALDEFLRVMYSDSKAPMAKKLFSPILENLTSPSHSLRQVTLQVLQKLFKSIEGHDSDVLDMASIIEDTTFSLENSRALSMYMRNLATKYETTSTDPWLKIAIPNYFFGLLNVQFAPVVEEACNSLKTIGTIKVAEDIVLQRAFAWIDKDLRQDEDLSAGVEEKESNYFRASQFECSNVLRLQNLAQRAAAQNDFASESLKERFKSAIAPHPLNSKFSRSLGLRVLSVMPQLAEKRSRVLVPYLLSWASNDSTATVEIKENENHESLTQNETGQLESRWSRKDQKALLGLFAQFTNPTVLYRAQDVRNGLLTLLTNGDVEIQRMALNALFTWKSPAIRPYQEHLLNILDDARFREEISIFLTAQEGADGIQKEHRAQLMPVLLRLLYGRLITRSGATNAHGGQETKRKAVLSALSRFSSEDLEEFIKIALGPLDNCAIFLNGELNQNIFSEELVSVRKQMGILRMIQDIFATLSNLLWPFSEKLIHAILYCAKSSSDALERSIHHADSGKEPNESIGLSKSVRQESMACINLLFTTFQNTDWKPYMQLIMDSVVNPRIQKLASENTQSVSHLLKLFSTWSESIKTVQLLFDEGPLLLQNLSLCLSNPNTRDDVKIFIMKSIIANICRLASDPVIESADFQGTQEKLKETLHQGAAFPILDSVARVLHQSQSQNLIEASLSAVLGLSPFITGSNETDKLLESAVYLLKQPAKIVNPRLKGEVLKVLEELIPESIFNDSKNLINSIVEINASLFAYFKDNPNRRRLVQILNKCSRIDTRLERVAKLCDELNSFRSSSLNVPDFDLRQAAYHFINEEVTSSLTLDEWRPIVFNMLFFIKDNDEYVIRTSASLSLRRFIKSATTDTQQSFDFQAFAEENLVPALQKGMSDPSELVRSEYVVVLADMISENWASLNDMKILVGPDEESSFFNNILHIQVHRRIRALRRLGDDAKSISSWNIAKFCLPLVEVCLLDSDDASGNLTVEAISALGKLSECLEWSRYRSLLQKKITEASKFDSKTKIKALGAVVDGLSRAYALKTKTSELKEPESTLQSSLPDQSQISLNISRTILPKLMEYVHFKDDSSINLRVLVAPIVVKLIMTLPAEDISRNLPPLLMDICNILKSRAQDARDTARKTLAEISAIVGSHYFGFILKQLRSSLQRGSHLDVLSYTVHSLLVSVCPTFDLGAIDYCLDSLMVVLTEDVFGAMGQEKDAQDYTSKMREVRKKNLSFDSIELVATITSLPKVSSLLRPLKEQLFKPKANLEKVDELFRRIKEGLRRNEAVNDRQFMVLCYEILVDAYGNDGVQRLAKPYSSRFASFAFEVLRRVLDKHEELKSPENLAGFLPMLESSLNQNDEDVQLAAFRFLSSIVKVQLDEFDQKASIHIHQAKTIIEDASSTNTPLCQTALRVVASILRERPNAPISQEQLDVDIAYLITRIRPDLREPVKQGERDRQVAAFNLLKAILNRGILLKEVYEVMDVVREVMITNTEHPIPDLARSVYSRFVLEYFPNDGKGLSKQVDFLVSNLQYPQPKGRTSIMEVVHFLLMKKDLESVQTLLTSFFLPLVLVLVTDESEECRLSAHLLVSKIFERAGKEQTKLFTVQLRKWLDPNMDILWQRAAMQCWKVLFDARKADLKNAQFVYGHASDIIKDISSQNEDMQKLAYDTLILCQCLCEIYPALLFTSKTTHFWTAIASQCNHTSNQITLESAKLLGIQLSHLAKSMETSSGQDLSELLILPLQGAYGYELDEDMAIHIVGSSLGALANVADETIASQIIQNIAFIGRLQGSRQEILPRIFSSCSVMIRKETDSSGLPGRLAALHLTNSLCKLVPLERLQPSLEEILMPLYNLTDSSIPKPSYTEPSAKAMQDKMVNGAHELLSQLQSKFGTSDFVNQMRQVQNDVRERREARRTKRRIDVVTAPEKAEREKQRRHLVKKVKRKEKNSLAAGMRRGW